MTIWTNHFSQEIITASTSEAGQHLICKVSGDGFSVSLVKLLGPVVRCALSAHVVASSEQRERGINERDGRERDERGGRSEGKVSEEGKK